MKYKAPAVHQAVEVIELLIESGPLTLARIADQTGFSKATLLRVLETLETHDWVSRVPGARTFESQVVVRSKRDLANYPEKRIQEVLDNLCNKTNHTVEWYQIRDKYVEIIQRSEPIDRVVRIKAKLGFRRPFSTELDAVVRIAAASGIVDCRKFEPEAGYKFYKNGEYVHIPLEESLELVSRVDENLLTYDREWNNFGIRRHAAGVKSSTGGLEGILAVATSFTPKADTQINHINELLQSSGRQLEGILNKSNA